MTAMPRVSIVVPCRNERRYIAECLDSIRLNDYAAESLEVLVVDGASDDGTREIIESYVQRWPTVRCLDNPTATTPAALNIGIRNANGDIIMRMDAHCHYPRDYISKLVQWLDQTGADNVGGVCRTLPGSDSPMARAIAIALSHPLGVGNSRFRIGTKSARWVDTVPFGCYRRDVFERIGLFDEELLRNQDDEFNQRLLVSGSRILLVPDVTVDYYARDSVSKLARMYYQYGYFKPLVARKLGRIRTFRQIVPATFLIALVTSLVLGIWYSSARYVFGGIVGVYLGSLLVASVTRAFKNDPGASALLAVVFCALHLSYGWGSLRGAVRFFLWSSKAPIVASRIQVSR